MSQSLKLLRSNFLQVQTQQHHMSSTTFQERNSALGGGSRSASPNLVLPFHPIFMKLPAV